MEEEKKVEVFVDKSARNKKLAIGGGALVLLAGGLFAANSLGWLKLGSNECMNNKKESKQERCISKKDPNFNQKLETAIKNGKITPKQKGLILAKKTEFNNKMNQEKRKVVQDKKEQHRKKLAYKKDLTRWAKIRGIKLGLLF